NNLVHYLVERSINGQPFEQVRKIPGQGITNNAINTYSWSEPFSGNQKVLYRVQLVTANDVKTSKVVLLEQAQSNEAVVSIANPFKNDIIIDVKSPQAGNIRVEILDNNGVVAGSQAFTISAGSNKLVMNKGAQLPAGFYTIRMISRERVWIKKTLKL
ncbi:MAG TPA: T9SS type A sorting domain-containing protein, partial [Chitinophagaceae bacterium]|nr:T9SS type A sorting domain-containing protein [Chitinophagaceae bacterium]